MKPSSLAFLKNLLDAPGPSGFEAGPARIWRAEAETFADEVSVDITGNSIAAVNPRDEPRIMFAGHVDEIGLMIVHVDDDGYLYFSTIGGWDRQVLVGQRVVIATRDGAVRGVIGRKAVHLLRKEERERVVKPSDLWIDIGAAGKEEALKRVRVGDPAVLDCETVEYPNGRLVSRSIDNRIGAFVVLETLRLISEGDGQTAAFAVATTQEEINWSSGGARTSATSIKPMVAIVVDVTHATDYPSVEKKEVGECKLDGGPVLSRGSAINSAVFDMLVETAEAKGIPYTLSAAPRDTGTDADAIYTAAQGIATALVSVPNRYMHSPNEMIALRDLDRVATLLAEFTSRLSTDTDFTPR